MVWSAWRLSVGENKLPDRLVSITEVNEKYQTLLKELSATAFTKEQLLEDAEAIEQATREIRAKETKAVAARGEPPPGFGGPAGPGPRPPDLKTFVEKMSSAKVTRHSKYTPFRLAEVAVTRNLFATILDRIAQLAIPPPILVGGMPA